MSETFDKSTQQALPGFGDAISSPGSQDGNTPSVSPDGPPGGPRGLAPAPANRFRAPVDAKARKTNGTSGQNSTASSASIALAQSLANRLVATTDLNGSMEYRLTWKSWVTRSRRRICALRARQRRTHASAFSGWPTPDAQLFNDNADPVKHLERMSRLQEKHRNGNGAGLTLSIAVQLIGWVSPTAQDHSRGDKPSREHDTGQPLSQQVAMVGWATPGATEWKRAKRPSPANRGRAKGEPAHLNFQVHGLITESSNEETEPADSTTAAFPLNPAMSRWLMGYPATWDAASPNFAAWLETQERIASAACEDMETPSFPKSPPNS